MNLHIRGNINLAGWCGEHNLSLNMKIIMDIRRSRQHNRSPLFRDEEVEQVSSFKFLGLTVTEGLSWDISTACSPTALLLSEEAAE